MMGGWAGAKPRARVGVGNLKKEGVLSILARARPEQQAAVLRAVLGRLTPKKTRPPSAYYRTYREGLGA